VLHLNSGGTSAHGIEPIEAEKEHYMAIVTKRTFELPSEGLHLAQITRVDDVGQVETAFGVKEKIRIIFTMLDEKGRDGTALDAMISANKVLGEKSTLGKLLAELKVPCGDTFDTDELIGLKTQVIISHKEGKDRNYANITIVPTRTKATVAEV
jgi:hypothetical protein